MFCKSCIQYRLLKCQPYFFFSLNFSKSSAKYDMKIIQNFFFNNIFCFYLSLYRFCLLFRASVVLCWCSQRSSYSRGKGTHNNLFAAAGARFWSPNPLVDLFLASICSFSSLEPFAINKYFSLSSISMRIKGFTLVEMFSFIKSYFLQNVKVLKNLLLMNQCSNIENIYYPYFSHKIESVKY